MKNILLYGMIIFIVPSIACSQQMALKIFLNADFIVEFDALQNKAIRSVEDFKAIQHLYSKEDITIVKDAYDASAGLFNNVLYNIKKDLLNKSKQKFINKYPEDFSKIWFLDFFLAKEYYEDYYIYAIHEVTDGRMSCSCGILFRPTTKKLEVIENFSKTIKKLVLPINEEILDAQLIQKHRFPLWDEIQ